MSDKWQALAEQIRSTKTSFDASYKCVNRPKLPKAKTQIKHLKILVSCHNNLVGIAQGTHKLLTQEHKKVLVDTLTSIKSKLETLFERLTITEPIPKDLLTPLNIRWRENSEHDSSDSGSDTETEESVNNSLTETASESNHHSPINEPPQTTTMTSTVENFVGNASKLIPDFDGKISGLQKFLDSLDLLDIIKGDHESVAVALIKSKLDPTTRGLITQESTIAQIKITLSSKIKGEPTKAIVAKLRNTKQGNRSTNDFVKEVEELTKTLERSYICDGVPADVAKAYSTETAITTLTTNGKSEQAKMSMKGVVYNNFADAVSKFVEISSEQIASVNIVRRYPQNNSNYRGRGHFSYNRNRYNRYNYNNTNFNNRNQSYGRNNYNNQRNSNNRDEQQRGRNRNNRNVRMIEAQSENTQDPQVAQLGMV